MKGKTFPNFDINSITLPPVDLKIIRRNGVLKVFDPLRKDYFILTNEEFVRQTFVAWLIADLGYPASLMANVIGIRLNDTIKRCDTVIFSSDGSPLMIVEYKSPSVKISQSVFDQIARYNMALNAKFLTVTNGIQHYCCKFDNQQHTYSFLETIPDYKFLKDFQLKNGGENQL